MTIRETLARFYLIFRWVLLAAMLLVLFLLLRPDEPPPIPVDERASERVEDKVARVEQIVARGQRSELRLDEAELNAWMRSNLAIDRAVPAQPLSHQPTVEEVQSNVRDVKVRIEGDQIRGYVLFEIYGKKMSLTLEGRLAVREGYLRLDPTAMKLGSLPIPRATLSRAIERLFESPENREQFRVPPNIRDIRVENGTLVVSY